MCLGATRNPAVTLNIGSVQNAINKMRKRFKIKKHSCALCKPNKMGGACRWKAKEFSLLKEFENIKKEHLLEALQYRPKQLA